MIDNPMARPVVDEDAEYNCEECGAAMWLEDDVFKYQNKTICTECMEDALRRMGLLELVDFMGIEVVKVSDL